MKQDRNEEGRFTEHGRGLGTVTEKMVRDRARELALINGRPDNVLDFDIEQARRELQREEPLAPESGDMENVPEEDRWEVVPDNTGKQVPAVPAPDEQTFAEKLVDEGVEEAEHDQMLEATKDEIRRDEAA